MYDRPWPVITGAVVGLLVGVLIGWLLLGGSDSQDRQAHEVAAGPIRSVNGVPVGVEHSRPGALAAADNYVATSSETVLQDPSRYERLVRATYAPTYQATALREGEEVRRKSPKALARYDAGARALALVAARRLDSYASDTAVVTTWRTGVVWGGGEGSEARWFLTRTHLRWSGGRWLVEEIEDARRAAPAPVLIYRDKASLAASTFDDELRGMTAPSYGVGG
jgi:hypothetical protein